MLRNVSFKEKPTNCTYLTYFFASSILLSGKYFCFFSTESYHIDFGRLLYVARRGFTLSTQVPVY